MPKPRGVRKILINLVVKCQISFARDKNRSYTASQHKIYNKALIELQELIDKKIDDTPVYGADLLTRQHQVKESIAELFGRGG